MRKESSKKIFKKLKILDWNFTKSKTNLFSHDLHPYPAKFIPQIPNQLISNLSCKGDLVWDPFGGCGTTALEALLLNRSTLSSDINPIGAEIGCSKTIIIDKKKKIILDNFKKNLINFSTNKYIDQKINFNLDKYSMYIPNIPNIKKWFNSFVIFELAIIKKYINEIKDKEIKILLRVVLSKIIIKVSNQDSETRYTAVKKKIKKNDTIKIFVSELEKAIKKLSLLPKKLKKNKATYKTLDLRKNFKELGNNNYFFNLKNKVNLIVTSPPYSNATDYHLYHRFRNFWLDFDPVEFGKKEIGSHLRHQKLNRDFELYLEEMESCLINFYYVLKKNSYACLVVGNSIFKSIEYKTSDELIKITNKIGFKFIGKINRQIHKTKRSFSSKRAVKEDIIIIKK